MYHPTTRLLTVLELLQTHEQMSATALSARLEVETRTVRRYVMMLQDMGIPIEAEMGRYGGYSLRPGYKLPPMMFTNDEALALILGLGVARQLGLAVESSAVEGASAKLRRVLPETLREQIAAVQGVLVMNLASSDDQITQRLLITLGQAAHNHNRVTIAYGRKGEETRRSVDPYGVVYYENRWYLVGYCHLRTDIRVFRLDRITDASAEDMVFTPLADFDPLVYLIESIATMPDQWDVSVILGTTLETAAHQIPPGLGILETHPDGVLLRTAVSDLDWMARYLVGLGFPLRVLNPPELKAAFKRLAAVILGYSH